MTTINKAKTPISPEKVTISGEEYSLKDLDTDSDGVVSRDEAKDAGLDFGTLVEEAGVGTVAWLDRNGKETNRGIRTGDEVMRATPSSGWDGAGGGAGEATLS